MKAGLARAPFFDVAAATGLTRRCMHIGSGYQLRTTSTPLRFLPSPRR